MGLLGHALALRAGMTYADLIAERICAPLGMESTRIALTPDLKKRLAPGHSSLGVPVSGWNVNTLAAASA